MPTTRIAGSRDLATGLVLGEAGLRCEELAGLERPDPSARGGKGKLPALDVRRAHARH